MSLLCDAFIHVDTKCVNTGEVAISKKTLVTSFVRTCSVLGFNYKGNNFLAHIDALDPNMKLKIINKLNILNPQYIKEIKIWKGSACNSNCPSFQLAKEIVSNLSGKVIYYQAKENLIKIG